MRTRYVAASVAWAVLAVVVGSSCTAQSQRTPPPPSMSVWMAGDSNGNATAMTMWPAPYDAAIGGSSFTAYNKFVISETIQSRIDMFGAPETLLVLGGVLDAAHAPLSEAIAAMEAFDAAMVAQGIRVIWILEPAWNYKTLMLPIWDWVLTRPETIDCRSVAGLPSDGVHPQDFWPFASCISRKLAEMGVAFVDRAAV